MQAPSCQSLDVRTFFHRPIVVSASLELKHAIGTGVKVLDGEVESANKPTLFDKGIALTESQQLLHLSTPTS